MTKNCWIGLVLATAFAAGFALLSAWSNAVEGTLTGVLVWMSIEVVLLGIFVPLVGMGDFLKD
jgi:hypothetical protein